MRRYTVNSQFNGQTWPTVTTDFDDPFELATFLEAMPKHLHYTDPTPGFSGDRVDPDYCARYLRTGDVSAVAEAERLLSEYEAAGVMTPKTPLLRGNIFGMCPIVPAMLAGHPDCMLWKDESDAISGRAPVNIMIDCGMIANVGTDTIRKRGIALLALVMALQTVRPIELRVFDTMTGSNDLQGMRNIMYTIAIPTNPLNLSQAAWMLTVPQMARAVPFNHTNVIRNSAEVSYAFGWRLAPGMQQYEQMVRKHWNLLPTDIVLVGGSNEQGITTDPLGWVQKQIEKFTHPD